MSGKDNPGFIDEEEEAKHIQEETQKNENVGLQRNLGLFSGISLVVGNLSKRLIAN